ncbi:MAG: hypothetical protein KDK48_04540 [Chlamydiia bacterium]|nr:hypothetical protein [Chlamydiia bacterium]
MTLFIKQYDKVVDRVALALGLAFGLYGVFATSILISSRTAITVLSLLPFFILRSLTANLQIKNFSYDHFGEIIISGLAALIGLVVILTFSANILEQAVLIGLLMTILILYLSHFRLPKFQVIEEKRLYTNLYSFLSNLKKTKELVEIYRLNLDENIQIAQKMQLIGRLLSELRLSADQICICSSHAILFFRPVSSAGFLLPNTVLAEVGNGLVRTFEQDLIHTNPELVEKNGLDSSFLNSPILRSVTDNAYGQAKIERGTSISKDELIKRFTDSFPTGVYYDPKLNLGPQATPPPVEDLRKIQMLIWKFLFRQKKSIRCNLDVSIWYQDDMVKIVFLIPDRFNIQAESDKILQWHKYIHGTNIMFALGN